MAFSYHLISSFRREIISVVLNNAEQKLTWFLLTRIKSIHVNYHLVLISCNKVYTQSGCKICIPLKLFAVKIYVTRIAGLEEYKDYLMLVQQVIILTSIPNRMFSRTQSITHIATSS